jgi:proline dehydrogenase
VYSVCTVPFLVRNAGHLINTSYRFLGPLLTNTTMKYTLFGHFCGGEDENTIKPTVEFLKRNGIGAIFDYAAESDVAHEDGVPEKRVVPVVAELLEPYVDVKAYVDVGAMPSRTSYDLEEKNKSRVYHYVDEDVCDKHLKTFENCIHSVNAVSPAGFAAIKITALGNPALLKRMSIVLNEIRELFAKFDEDGTGLITKEQFHKRYKEYFNVDPNFEDDAFNTVDIDNDGIVDYYEWSNAITMENAHKLVQNCKNKDGPLTRSMLNTAEMADLARMRTRVDHLAGLAYKLNVRLMVDAEHSYFQPGIDNIAQQLSTKYNTGTFPIIFNTYQMYLKDAHHRLQVDFERAQRNKTHFAAKLVRGAYMVLERAHAIETNQTDPILPSLEQTHENYNGAVKEMLGYMAEGKKVEIMIASHNQKSIELTLAVMQAKGLDPTANVYFGQLLGMADHLTFHLGSAGYKAYKYVPYGKVNEVMPYLIRRAQENADVLGAARAELRMIGKELVSRLSPFR